MEIDSLDILFEFFLFKRVISPFFLLICMHSLFTLDAALSQKVLVSQWCLTLCNPMDCSPPGSSVHGILQARMLEWVAIPFSKGSSWPRDQILVSCIAGRFFTVWATREAPPEIYIYIWKQILPIWLTFYFLSGILGNRSSSCSWSLIYGSLPLWLVLFASV